MTLSTLAGGLSAKEYSCFESTAKERGAVVAQSQDLLLGADAMAAYENRCGLSRDDVASALMAGTMVKLGGTPDEVECARKQGRVSGTAAIGAADVMPILEECQRASS